MSGLAYTVAGCASDGPPSLGGDGSSNTGGWVDGGLTATGGSMTGGPGVPDGGSVLAPEDSGAIEGGTGGSSEEEKCGSIEEQAEVQRGPVDVIIALDSSASMVDEICNVSANLTRFADGVGPDTHVAAVYQILELYPALVLLCQQGDPLAETALAMDSQRYLHVDARVDSYNALQVLVDDFGRYESFLRPGAPTHFIVVSDDESHLPSDAFLTQMESLLGDRFYFHAIVATGGSCGGAGVGHQYMTLATQTGGEQLSICESDWSALFAELEAAVAASAPLPCEFDIPEPPDGESFSPDGVNVRFTSPSGVEEAFLKAPDAAACGQERGWHFDSEDDPTRIRFCPAACEAVKQGGDLGIQFGAHQRPGSVLERMEVVVGLHDSWPLITST